MLRNLGIRSKILAVLALPALVLIMAASIIAAGAVSAARTARQVEKIAAAAPGESLLIRGLQAERTLSIAVLAGDESARPKLEEVRKQLDAGLAEVEDADIKFDRLDDSAQEAVDAADVAVGELDTYRQQVDGQTVTLQLMAQNYALMIDAELAQIDAIALAVTDRDLSAYLQTFVTTERLAELVAQEGDLGLGGIAAGRYTPEMRNQQTGLVAAQQVLRRSAEDQNEQLGIRLPATSYPLQLARQRTLQDPDGVIDSISPEQWLTAIQGEIASFAQGQTKVGQLGIDRSSKLADGATAYAWQVAGIALVAVALPLLFALFIARRITRPLRRLTEAAAQIRAELPNMVERMQTPGEGPGMEMPDIPVESNDEVGRLAVAFNDVNSTTVQVAQEQAALRGSIAAMFVNVARRDQVLLSRQLAFIDQLERTEENPATLENLFKLDHLATRMRRNAESLLVLAGIDTGRRLRRPMPLSDVIRTASSEIEHYERVDLALRVDPPMVGHMALSTAHLLAEIMENATRFSNPDTRVVVATGTNARGVVITITDSGLGMSPDELADANARMSDSSASEVVGAQRLGFFVVGRLARKLDAKVTVRAGRSNGTVVTIELAPALFVPGSVVEIPGSDDVAADTTASGQGNRIALPDTATAALQARGQDSDNPSVDAGQPASEVEVAPAADTSDDAGQAEGSGNGQAVSPAPPAPAPVTDSGLPRRGANGLPVRQRTVPSSPVPTSPLPASPAPISPVPTPPIPTQAAPSPVESTPVAGTDGPPAVTGNGLPIRARGARPAPATPSAPVPPVTPVPTPPVAPLGTNGSVPAAEPAAPARAGALFSAFRARRPEAADAVDSAPQTAEPVVEPVAESVAAPVVEVAESVDVAPTVDEPVAAEAPAVADVADVADVAAPDSVQPVDVQPVGLADDVQPVGAQPVDGQPVGLAPIVEAATPADVPADAPSVDPATVELPASDAPRSGRRFAASELTALASTPGPVAQPEPEPEPVVEPEPQPIAGAAAVTILPGGGRGRSFLRGRKSAKPASVEPVLPMTRRELRRLEQSDPRPTAPAEPAPTPFAPTAPGAESQPVASSQLSAGAVASDETPYAPTQPALASALPTRPPVPAQPSAVEPAVETSPFAPPVAAPSSLFATPSTSEPEAKPIADGLRQRSALASEALAELSMLSSYSPAAVDEKPPSTLSRRTPASTPAATLAAPRPTAARRERSASDVRSMLSGFQAGVARGRTSPSHAAHPAPGPGEPDADS